jgi:hypothetical protein
MVCYKHDDILENIGYSQEVSGEYENISFQTALPE